MTRLARLAEINNEYKSMGLTPEWVDEYSRLSQMYLDPPTDLPSHNGSFLMLPEGTIPDNIYTDKLNQLTKRKENLDGRMRAAKRLKAVDRRYSKDEYIRCFGKVSYAQEEMKNADMCRQQLKEANEIQYELRMHLTKFRPINVQIFHDNMDSLIKEQNLILTNICIDNAPISV
jgi:hypothetical protein